MAFISVFALLSWGFIDTKAFTIDLSVSSMPLPFPSILFSCLLGISRRSFGLQLELLVRRICS